MAKSLKIKELKPEPSKRFRMSKVMLQKLPFDERATVAEVLWDKSAGRCALCGEPLDPKPDLNVADHVIPESVDPSGTKVQNLYLAHLSCNASKKDLPFELAKKIIEFKVFAEKKSSVTFDDVISRYLLNGDKAVEYVQNETSVNIKFGVNSFVAALSIDPATGTKYFFAELPFECIRNDTKIQPRLISYAHVRKLALDFVDRPVHEPSNCRLVPAGGDTAFLLQFDGQHKSTAQILLRRETGPFKIYVDPDIAMLQKLVIKIQQEIKKVPLTRSETLAKLGDVLARLLEDYDEDNRTEAGFISSQSTRKEQQEVKRLYLGELRSLAFFDGDNEIAHVSKPSERPTTDAIIIDRIIGPLIFNDLLAIDMDAAGGRDIERANIVSVLNRIKANMMPDGWRSDPIQKRRAETFFLGGAITWWMSEILIPALRYALIKMSSTQPLLLDPMDTDAESRVMKCIDIVCGWEIWSTNDPEKLAALRSNTVKNVTQAFPEHTATKLIQEMSNG